MRARGSCARLREMSHAPTITVTMQLATGAEPIEGSLRVGDGPSQSFRGWLQLTGLLQDAAAGMRADSAPTKGST